MSIDRRMLVVVSLLALVPGFGPGYVAESPPSGNAAAAITVDVERSMLEETLRQRASLSASRSEVLARLGRLYRTLDAEFDRQDGLEPERLERLAEQLRRLDHELRSIMELERQIVEKLADGQRRLRLLESRVASMEGRQDEPAPGPLEGIWQLVMMPSEQRGTWNLRQDGAVINGTYRLDGGWSGSLQGTLVERKVFLIRIDSKLGKVMEYEGYLSRDGSRVTGTWLNYELAGAAGASGQWTARKKDRGAEVGP